MLNLVLLIVQIASLYIMYRCGYKIGVLQGHMATAFPGQASKDFPQARKILDDLEMRVLSEQIERPVGQDEWDYTDNA
jgi:hypothetical protein